MIYRDSVAMTIRTDDGDLRDDWDRVRIPALVQPLKAETRSDPVDPVNFAIPRYQVILAPRYRLPPVDGKYVRIAWRLFDDDDGEAGSLKIVGTVQEFWFGRRLHHYEAITEGVGTKD